MPARAYACAAEAPGTCFNQFTRLHSVDISPTGDVVAVGDLQDGTFGRADVGLLIIPPGDADPVTVPVMPPTRDSVPERTSPRRVLALPDGDFLVLGDASYDNGEFIRIWGAQVGPQGQMRWSRVYLTDGIEQQFIHDATLDEWSNVIAVGRQQVGRGDSTCSNFSQGLIVRINLRNPDRLEYVPVRDPSGAQRSAFYAVEPGTGRDMTVAGFRAQRDSSGTCVDDGLVMHVTAQGMGDPQRSLVYGEGDRPEILFDMARFGDALLAVGMRYRGRPEALFLEIDGQSIDLDGEFTSAEGSGGRDRFTSLVIDEASQTIVLAGHYSETDAAKNKAWWRVLSANFEEISAGRADQYVGSTIEQIALGSDGAVVAVGTALPVNNNDSRVGWFHVLRAGTGTMVGALERRVVNASLPALEAGSAVNLAGQPVRGLTGALRSGDRFGLAFELGAPRTVRAMAHTADGNVDLLVLGDDGALQDFSGFAGDATEYVEVNLPAGRYRLEVAAIDAASTVEIAMAAGPASYPDALVPQLDATTRMHAATILARSGYNAGFDAELGAADMMTRALIAANLARGGRFETSGGLPSIQELVNAAQ